MADLDVGGLVDEMLSAMETAGEIERWVELRLPNVGKCDLLSEAFRQATQRLLGATPPDTVRWEHLLLATAAAAKSNPKISSDVCKTAIDELCEMVRVDGFIATAPEHVVTLTSAMTMALAAQRKLRQSVEIATSVLHEKFPELLPDMAERCQDIWQRHGQMSGMVGLFIWDSRKNEWRLNQDFKQFRSS